MKICHFNRNDAGVVVGRLRGHIDGIGAMELEVAAEG
jgi:hypothetical protein